jgi:hypothetical protein
MLQRGDMRSPRPLPAPNQWDSRSTGRDGLNCPFEGRIDVRRNSKLKNRKCRDRKDEELDSEAIDFRAASEADGLLGDEPEPAFHLIEPGRVGGRVTPGSHFRGRASESIDYPSDMADPGYASAFSRAADVDGFVTVAASRRSRKRFRDDTQSGPRGIGVLDYAFNVLRAPIAHPTIPPGAVHWLLRW